MQIWGENTTLWSSCVGGERQVGTELQLLLPVGQEVCNLHTGGTGYWEDGIEGRTEVHKQSSDIL